MHSTLPFPRVVATMMGISPFFSKSSYLRLRFWSPKLSLLPKASTRTSVPDNEQLLNIRIRPTPLRIGWFASPSRMGATVTR